MITINGQEHAFTPGQSVLDATRAAGEYVPTLCMHDALEPYGGCRLCLVKVDGIRGYPPACTTPAHDGMAITTDDEDLLRLRQEILKLILSEHPNSCLMCRDKAACAQYKCEPEKAGRITGCHTCPNLETCELREVMDRLELTELDLPSIYRNLPIERDDPFFARDLNLCILCGKCVRVCQEVVGVGAIAFVGRGADTRIGTAFGSRYMDGPCIFCGACVDVCPTGALSAHGTKWFGKEDSGAATTCTLCGLGCQVELKEKWGKTVASVPVPGAAPSNGRACALGRFCLPPLFNHKDRLTFPYIRRDGVLAPTDWDTAIRVAAEGLGKVAASEIALVASQHLTNEAAYLLGRLGREAWPDSQLVGDAPFARTVLASLEALNGQPVPAAAVERLAGSDAVLLVGAHVDVLHGPLVTNLKAARDRGAAIASIGRWSQKDNVVIGKHLSVEGYAGPLAALVNALASGGVGIEGHEALVTSLAEADELPPALADVVAKMQAGRVTIVIGDDILGPDIDAALAALLNVAKLTGDEDGLLVLLGANSRGVHDVLGGLGAINGDTKAVYTTNGRLEVPDSVEFLVVQELFPTELSERADVVLPAAGLPAEDGTVTSFEGRTQAVHAVAVAPGLSISDERIFAHFGLHLGLERFDAYVDQGGVADELKANRPAAADAGIERLLPLGGQAARADVGATDEMLYHRGTYLPDVVPDLDILLSNRGITK